MAVDPRMQDEVERRVAALSPREFQRPSMSIDDFIKEMGGTLGQACADRKRLEQSGFDWGQMPLYNALFENLLDACRDRSTALANTPAAKLLFDEQLKAALEDRAVLKEVASVIVKRTGDDHLKKTYLRIIRGNSRVKLLTSIEDLIAFVENYPQIVSQTRPGGIVIDRPFLDRAKARVEELLALKGIVINDGNPENRAVLRQNALITLCLSAQTAIKDAAHTAFFNDISYYRKSYCSEARRAKDRRLRDKKEHQPV